MTTVHPRRPARRYGPDGDPAVAGTEALLQSLSRREPVPVADDVVRLLSALIEDVDHDLAAGQRLSSVSITPSA
ncbi:hypothetical protein Ppa06_11760 [Planomonospora parontospora subsp. parontospora]|uniref:Uncharacterized protein n=2 Tax=Planomonospora parontospora TaxID=58119 RepID=A0AA37BDH1_9ACTN|nr:hypothetical protein [Planomonospora parontospora]GGK55528.1 hypothetical protein GCM10010126_13820 [Planomonospora parontospora]GII07378.1 hypothetical protein Ppa06_11760 [Planomonospora parontospora subsp. parontospora]